MWRQNDGDTERREGGLEDDTNDAFTIITCVFSPLQTMDGLDLMNIPYGPIPQWLALACQHPITTKETQLCK